MTTPATGTTPQAAKARATLAAQARGHTFKRAAWQTSSLVDGYSWRACETCGAILDLSTVAGFFDYGGEAIDGDCADRQHGSDGPFSQ